MDKGTLSLLLEKFRQGTCTPEEQQLLYKWLDALEQDNTAPAPLPETDMQFIKQQMLQQILPVGKKSIRLRFIRAAAVILPLTIATYFIWQNKAVKQQLPATAAWRTEQNTGSQLKRIVLPDNSVVLLGRHSSFQYLSRSVKMLEGKAFFDISTDPTHPFTVEDATGIRTTVLGTSFTIEVSQALHLSRIAVATGKVKVQETVLLPSQRLTCRGNTNIPVQDNISTSDLMAWTKGEIVLRNATLEELLLTIKTQYGITARTSLNVHQGNYTIRFPATMALPEVLDIIQKISYKPKIHFTMLKNQLSIY